MTKLNDAFSAARAIWAALIPDVYSRPAEWAERNLVFSHAKDPIPGPLDLSLTPYLIDPINAWELERGQGLKEITVMAPEQTGKSLSWMAGELWSFSAAPGLSLIYYTSDEKAARVNEEKIEPLLRGVPEFARLLDLPGAKTADCYRLGGNLSYFSGVGARIASFTARRSVADEIDDWATKAGVSPLADLRKRARAFGEALLCKVCTPKGTRQKSRIWKEFEKSSRGFWHLRCLGCDGLTLRSCDVHNLKFARDAEGGVVPGSCRLVCPVCGREHFETEKIAMNARGKYVHRDEVKVRSVPGFQWGALASVFPAFAWEKIAEAQVLAGKSGELDDQIYFDNSIRGLPFSPRKLDTSTDGAFRRHGAPIPASAELRWRMLSADTQDNGWFWVVRGFDAAWNSYLLDCGFSENIADFSALWGREFGGGKLTCGIVDEGGHMADEVRSLTAPRAGFFAYKGNPRIGVPYKISDNDPKLLLANPERYRLKLLHSIYAAANRGNHFWYLPTDPPAAYLEQLASWRSNPAVKNGDKLENFICPSGNDHYFDAEKMMMVLTDYFIGNVLPLLQKTKKVEIRRV